MGEKCCALTRRNYIKGSAGALVAAGYLGSAGLAAAAPPAAPNPVPKTYKCPPCGQPCDKLSFDKPGTCPNCGMTLVPADGQGPGLTRVAILLFDGAEIIDFAGPWEAFGTAGFLMHTVAPKLEPMTMVFGQKVMADYTFENSPKADILLVPGGGIFQYLKDERMMGWLRAKANEVDHVMSVCTGAYLLAKAGLLVGQTVTATYGMIEDFEGPQTRVVYDRRYVDNGKIITTAGLSSGIDGALHLIAKTRNLGTAQAVALAIEYPWEPDGKWARAALADRYLPHQLTAAKAKVEGAELAVISTHGDTDRWETRLRVSGLETGGEVVALLRGLIGTYMATGGMYRQVSHIKTAPVFRPGVSDSELRWTFTDDQNRGWNGTAIVTPGTGGDAGMIATLSLTRRA
jgi:putative intracellular protease/amidase